jgi:site-specific DNA-methyltransferase (adenine-specific)
MSNRNDFRYEIIWKKGRGTGFLNSNRMPLKFHENICVFYKKLPIYHPQYIPGERTKKVSVSTATTTNYRTFKRQDYINNTGQRRLGDVLEFNSVNYGIHPTQKPLELIKCLLLTYTDRGGYVLDNCMGSGTTALACLEEGRNFIGFELEKEYYELAEKRIKEVQGTLNMY